MIRGSRFGSLIIGAPERKDVSLVISSHSFGLARQALDMRGYMLVLLADEQPRRETSSVVLVGAIRPAHDLVKPGGAMGTRISKRP
jgi:hypothetical protein